MGEGQGEDKKGVSRGPALGMSKGVFPTAQLMQG